MFDLTIFPLFLVAGREQYELPGLYVAAAPRKAARMRAQDMLILFWRINLPSGTISTALTGAQQQEILSRLSETYFETPGSVTNGLRAVVNRLNDFQLNRNLKGGPEGQMIGTLNLAALHGDSLMLAHTGPAHSFVLNKNQAQHFDDSPLTREGAGGRGLGLARQVTPRFYQSNLEAGDMLVLSSDPPAGWTPKTLAGSAALTLDQLRRRLFSEVVDDLLAVVIRTQAGKGKVTYWRPQDRPAGDRDAATQRRSAPAAPATPAAPAVTAQAAPTPAARPVPSQPLANPPPAQTGTPSQPRPETPLSDRPSIAGPLMSEPARPAPVARPLPPAQEPPAADLPADPQAETQKGVQLPPVGFPPPPAGFPPPPAGFPPPPAGLPPPPADLREPDLSAETNLTEISLPPIAAFVEAGTEEETPSETEMPVSDAPAGDLPAEPASRPASGVVLHGTMPAASEPASRPVVRPAQRMSESQPPAVAPGVDQSASPARPAPRTNGKSASAKPAAQRKGLFAWLGGKPPAATVPAAGTAKAQSSPKPAQPAPLATPRSESLRRGLASIFQKGRAAREKVSTATGKVLPGQALSSLPQAWLLLLAIAVPLMVVAVATTVYVRAGQAEQFTRFFTQAQQYAAQAQQLADPLQQKEAWVRAYDLSNQAITRYDRDNVEARALRQQALTKLDEMDGIVRLGYQPLREALGPDVKITKIVSTLTGVYLLDSSQGRIFRLQPSTTGYTFDPQFNCGPGKAGSSIITQLIDIAPLPLNNQLKADIMGLDGGGNLVYCSANLEGFDSKLLPLPDNGWGKITAMTTLGDALFVLDPMGNAVYRYDGDNGIYISAPHLYFDIDIPRMSDVIDLDVDQEFLYLLHANGEMTVCDSGGVTYVPVKCTDPAPYGDWRLGYDPAPLTFSGTQFSSIQATQPPAASLFALDQVNRAIYHLSLRKLNLQFQYRPKIESDFPLPNTPPTGFAITLNRRALIAFGNQIYYAQIP